MSAKQSQPSIFEGGFEVAFRRAARRVLLRRGVPEDQIEAEITRLRSLNPDIRLPTIDELEAGIEPPE